MEIISGIYKITNKINGKCYIGKSIDIYQRWNRHKIDSRPIQEGGDTCTIHNAIRKYGLNNFSFEIVEIIDLPQLNEREKYWINFYDSYYNGYNDTFGGEGTIKYDYKSIANYWRQGYNCQQIKDIFNCDLGVITRALRLNDITEDEVRSRSNHCKPIIAYDIITLKPLKNFSSIHAACIFFDNNLNNYRWLLKALDTEHTWKGYYWKTNNNNSIFDISDEEFLQYQKKKKRKFPNFLKNIEQRSIEQRQVERCSREELKALIRTTSFVQIGNNFGVSDNAIRKWCDYYKLPRRKKDIKVYSNEEWENI